MAGSEQHATPRSLDETLDWVRRDSSTRSYLKASRLLSEHSEWLQPLQPLRVGVLSTANLDPLEPYLALEFCALGFAPQLYFGPFGQVEQEALNAESGLYTFKPDLVVLLSETRHHVPSLWGTSQAPAVSPDAAVGELRLVVDRLLDSKVPAVLLCNLETPARPVGGILDHQRPDGAVDAVRRINRELETWAQRTPGLVLMDYEQLTSRFGKTRWRDARLWHMGRIPLSASAMPAFAAEVARYGRAVFRGPAKCLVVDLDNTLWGGVVGEEGVGGIQLGKDYPGSAFVEVQLECWHLQRRGILLAVCSKNNEQDALDVFDHHPDMVLRREHFAAMTINWRDKAENVETLATRLNLGLDAFVFLDDSPVERLRVKSALPAVTVPDVPEEPSLRPAFIRDLPWFEQLSLSQEDLSRTALYRSEARRHEFAGQVTDIEDFLRGLRMKLRVGLGRDPYLSRITQLTQKTNQFNLTTRRYTQNEIQDFVTSVEHRVYRAHVEDRFGDSGLVGVVIVHTSRDVWEIDTFLLSCRVLGRGVETGVLARVMQDALESGAERVRGVYIETAKNAPASGFYREHGFERVADEEPGVWEFALSKPLPRVPEYLEIEVD